MDQQSPQNPQQVKSEPRPRGTKVEPPFCWQSKDVLRIISRAATLRNPAHTLLVYFGLTWESSDRQSATFQATKGYLSKERCGGLGKRTIEYALDELEQLGLLRIERTKLQGQKANAVNTYTLLSLAHTVREGSAHNAGGSRTGRRASGAGNKKNLSKAQIEEEREKEKSPAAACALPPEAAAQSAGEDNLPDFCAWTR